MPVLFPKGLKGLSDSKYSGIEGSASKVVGIDLHSEPGLIKVQQALAKDSGTTVDALCKHSITVSSGETFWFSSTTGKIWRRSTAGAWLLVYTTSPAAGNAGCLGAIEFNGYIIWATQSRLHRIAIGSIATAQNWTDNVTLNWQTFSITDTEFHPMVVRGVNLFIGDGYYVAKVSSAFAFTANALDIKTPHRIKTMIEFDIDLLIGTIISTSVNKCMIIRWDTYDEESWQTDDTIDENGVNCFIKDDNYVYAQCGTYGRMYFYDGARLIPYKRIPGTWSPTSYGEIYPDASATLLTIPIFGLSNGSGNPTEQGVYSFGSYSKDYPKVLDLSFPISSGATSSVQIGSVRVVGADLLVSWYDGSNYGVDKLNYSAKYSSAYIETMILTPPTARHFIKTLKEVYANYSSLPASTAITFKYKKKHDTSWSSALATVTDSTLLQIKSTDGTIPDVASLQLRFDFTVSSNNAPTVENFGYKDNTEK